MSAPVFHLNQHIGGDSKNEDLSHDPKCVYTWGHTEGSYDDSK